MSGFLRAARAHAPAAALLAALLALPAVDASAELPHSFRPMTDEERALTRCAIDPGADAEILEWDVRAEDMWTGDRWRTDHQYYLRVKVYTDRGRQVWSAIPLWSASETGLRLVMLEGRTLLPDGSVVKLRSTDLHERTVERARGVKRKAKSVLMPDVQIGAVIELRWKWSRTKYLTHYAELPFSWEDTPIRKVAYHVKPYVNVQMPPMRIRSFQIALEPMVKEPDGFYRIAANGTVRAFRSEPEMPSETVTRPWLLLYYAEDPGEPAKYWTRIAKKGYAESQSGFKPTNEVRALAERLLSGLTGDEARLRRLYDYCHREIRNLNDLVRGADTLGVLDDREKDRRSPTQVLKDGVGNGRDIDVLFGALAQAAGYEARWVRIGARDRNTLEPSWPDDYFLTSYVVAVRSGTGWRFFDPGSPFVPFDMLLWNEEAQTGVLCDPKEPSFVMLPASPAAASPITRIGTFTLSAEGTLEGDVRIESGGHAGVRLKRALAELSPLKQIDDLGERMRMRFGDAQLTAVKIENSTDPDRPLIESFHVTIPGYAQATGRRLFVQPAVFHKGIAPRFTAARRQFPIEFDYSWSEFDSVTIRLPDGFTLEKPVAPRALDFGDFGRYQPRLEVAGENTLIYRRAFRFGRLFFGSDEYEPLKADFEELHRNDAHALVVSRPAATP